MTQPKKTLDFKLELSHLPYGQRRVAEAFISGKSAKTYKALAQDLELSLGTVYEHLRRIRIKHPETYQALMSLRQAQLEARHKRALANAKEHSRKYFRRKRNLEYYQCFGYWPWERYVRKG